MKRQLTFNIFGPKFFILLLVGIAALPALSQITSSGTGNAGATIVEQNLSVESIQPINFGSIFPISTAASVRLSLPNNAPTGSVSVIKSDSNVLVTGSPTAGRWEITGVGNSLVTVTLPANPITIEDTASNTMVVSDWAITSTSGNQLNLFLASNGLRQFAITATLAVGANQTAGGYTGTYPISVSYQ